MIKPLKLTSAQLKAIRLKMDLSQTEFGNLLGLDRQSIRRREAGEIEIDQQFARAVKNIEDSIK